jgi:hypothetical protein
MITRLIILRTVQLLMDKAPDGPDETLTVLSSTNDGQVVLGASLQELLQQLTVRDLIEIGRAVEAQDPMKKPPQTPPKVPNAGPRRSPTSPAKTAGRPR